VPWPTWAPSTAKPAPFSSASHTEARATLNRGALTRLDDLDELRSCPEPSIAKLRHNLIARIDHEAGGDDGNLAAYRELRREVIALHNDELRRLYDDHLISGTTRRRLQHVLDLEETGLGDRARRQRCTGGDHSVMARPAPTSVSLRHSRSA
jgi:hypothetical protein